jgi:hypothetical protein
MANAQDPDTEEKGCACVLYSSRTIPHRLTDDPSLRPVRLKLNSRYVSEFRATGRSTPVQVGLIWMVENIADGVVFHYRGQFDIGGDSFNRTGREISLS